MKRYFLIILSLISITISDLMAQSNSNKVPIGTQVWMSENLKVNKFRNGDMIPEAKSEQEWKAYAAAGEPAWCYFEYDSNNEAAYGKLYNCYAVSDSRNLAPKGWHVPDALEWIDLIEYLGGNEKAGARMKSKIGWNEEVNGTNSSGFSAIPNAICYPSGLFYYSGKAAIWWSSTQHTLAENDEDLGKAWGYYLIGSEIKLAKYEMSYGLSVRCLKD